MNRRIFLKNTSLASLSAILIGSHPDVFGQYSQPLQNSTVYLIKDAEILTMDKSLGHLPKASILIENGIIKKIGPDLIVPSGAKVDDIKNHRR